MSNRTVAEKESNLSELLDRVVDGEGLIITREGEPVAELRPVYRDVRPDLPAPSVTVDDVFLKLLREIPQHIKDAAVADVRAVRDEDDE